METKAALTEELAAEVFSQTAEVFTSEIPSSFKKLNPIAARLEWEQHCSSRDRVYAQAIESATVFLKAAMKLGILNREL